MKAIVIGGTSGFGKGISKILNDNGFKVTILGRTSTPKFDVTDDNIFKSYFDNVKDIDVFVYSAGIAIGKDFIQNKDIQYVRSVFEVNTIGLYKALKYAPKILKKGGLFVYIGSIANELSYVGGADYCASKAASSTIIKTARKEWLGNNLRITSMEVGLGNTSFQYNRYNGDLEKANKHTKGVRQIEPIDLGKTILDLYNTPRYINIDEVVYKPIDQASHGITVNSKQF